MVAYQAAIQVGAPYITQIVDTEKCIMYPVQRCCWNLNADGIWTHSLNMQRDVSFWHRQPVALEKALGRLSEQSSGENNIIRQRGIDRQQCRCLAAPVEVQVVTLAEDERIRKDKAFLPLNLHFPAGMSLFLRQDKQLHMRPLKCSNVHAAL